MKTIVALLAALPMMTLALAQDVAMGARRAAGNASRRRTRWPSKRPTSSGQAARGRPDSSAGRAHVGEGARWSNWPSALARSHHRQHRPGLGREQVTMSLATTTVHGRERRSEAGLLLLERELTSDKQFDAILLPLNHGWSS